MTLFKDATFFIWDTETTGLNPEVDGVCEAACSLFREGEVIFSWSSLVNPGVPIPPEASAIHHLTDKHIAGAPTLEEALWDCATKMEEAGISPEPPTAFVAHNAAFDSKFLPMLDRAPWLCTLRWARHLWPENKSYTNQYLRYFLGLDVPEAEGLASHRALADVQVTTKLLEYLARFLPESWPQQVEELIPALDLPILQRTCRFKAHDGKPWCEVPKDYLNWLINNRKDLNPDTLYTIQFYLQQER